MALGRLQVGAKYSHRVWEPFADTFRDYTKPGTSMIYMDTWIYGHQIRNMIFGSETDFEF